MLNRRSILERAYHECMREMYSRAQPSCDYDQLLKDAADGKIGKEERVYERYYLSQAEFKYILEKYIQAYNIKRYWDDYIEILQKYLAEGGSKDKYINSYTDEHGIYHPGYRGYESVPKLKEQINNILKVAADGCDLALLDQIRDKITNKVFEIIDDCKTFYKFDSEESSFSASVALGASPSSSAERVKEYWKEEHGIDIEIEERNPLLFYEKDKYGDEFEVVMEEEYGEDWKEYWDDKWKKEKKYSG